MSEFLEAVDAGHYQKSVEGKLVCRACGEPHRCSTLQRAQRNDAQRNRKRRAT